MTLPLCSPRSLRRFVALLGTATLFVSAAAHARDHIIALDVATVDGKALEVAPGDRLLIAAGPRRMLRLENLTGSADAPVIIINDGGQVVIHNDDQFADILISHSRHLHLTGTGSADHAYGFHLTGTNPDGSGIIAAGLSSDLEIDHIHIQDTGFAGMLVKTDGAVNTFMDHINIHHNFIHDTGGEGLYIGETKYPGQVFRHLKVWNNVIVNAGWESLQISNAPEDVRVHHNVFLNSGREEVLWQDNNLQFTSSVRAEVDHNLVIGSISNLVIASGGLPKHFHDNYLATDGSTGPVFYLDDSRFPDLPETTFIIENNFIHATPTMQAVVQANGSRSRLQLRRNIWQGARRFLKTHRWVDTYEVVQNTNVPVAPPRFRDPAVGDYRLVADDVYLARGIGLLPDWQPPGRPQAIE
ncbi:right-handed parallel beta-helix repeat-containing protein [Synoicihabitans lomoniglobus]|uniref:Right-handed parallel beta-helix repeat-containing protein n=1 Tax=Synoicihabitans lomoniglobus TaxID=2909285 RepID=A0AAE9ZWK4_9BACT|nr:right-handed parallel beta-helix repeat-containing protein [Opitutaceae bacterium LMO-M01]WED64210.1 right-handed parallel beta-helix repeat-containing protein [Opitutaceae bacterium LMO-M01]